jgi:hypothetical protein
MLSIVSLLACDNNNCTQLPPNNRLADQRTSSITYSAWLPLMLNDGGGSHHRDRGEHFKLLLRSVAFLTVMILKATEWLSSYRKEGLP